MVHRRAGESILVVLGAPNNLDGSLTDVARRRCERAVREYAARPAPVVATGGFGAHFNTTARPHYSYVYAFLRDEGVADRDILEGVPSSNTYEDVTMTSELASQRGVTSLRVITSEFHCRRVFLLYRLHAPWRPVEVIGAESWADRAELEALLAHEARAIARIYEEHDN